MRKKRYSSSTISYSRSAFYFLSRQFGFEITGTFFSLRLLSFIFPLSAIFFISCSSETGESGKSAKSGSAGSFEEPQKQNDAGRDSTRQIDPAAGLHELEGMTEEYMKTIFGDTWSRGEVTWEDEFPKFAEAGKSLHYKWISGEAETGEYGKVIPRMGFKSFRFADQATMMVSANSWLRGEESSEPSLTLGQDARAFKSPPFLFAATEKDVFILKTACMYQGAQWKVLKENFKKVFSGEGILYRFEVGCNAGQIVYDIVDGKVK